MFVLQKVLRQHCTLCLVMHKNSKKQQNKLEESVIIWAPDSCSLGYLLFSTLARLQTS
jgi:hypothetical protein